MQEKTGEKCKTCGQDIKKRSFNIYDGEEGRNQALLDCCQKKDGKAKYAYIIAEEIVNCAPAETKIPPKVKALFTELEKILKEGDPVED
ncbi:hypothetical protein SDC9_190498 [bioreactor metagenome]|uniref:Uncharacterized protein n=1 Tax=bioreactor metagenome TaxID=1076179 RepID=A0A645HVQ7_9ZZZZ